MGEIPGKDFKLTTEKYNQAKKDLEETKPIVDKVMEKRMGDKGRNYARWQQRLFNATATEAI